MVSVKEYELSSSYRRRNDNKKMKFDQLSTYSLSWRNQGQVSLTSTEVLSCPKFNMG